MLSRDWLKAFVPLGILRSPTEFSAVGAGVLVHVPPRLWLVTANHVVRKTAGQPLIAMLPRRSKGVGLLNLNDVHEHHGITWLADEHSDIAITPFPIHAEADVKAVVRENCIFQDDVVASMGALTVGCPYGMRGVDPQMATPLVLSGIVSGVFESDSIIYTSAPTFPGNSGGPLLVIRAPFNPEGVVLLGAPTVFLAGVMRDLVLVRSGPDTLPALHLGVATAIDRVWTLLESPAAAEVVAQLSRKQAHPA